MSARHLRHQVGRRRRNNNEVALAAQPDVADVMLVIAVEKLAEDAVTRYRANGKRGHELLGSRGQDAPNRDATLAQPADQVQAFVGGNPATDDEEHPSVVHAIPPDSLARSIRRLS